MSEIKKLIGIAMVATPFVVIYVLTGINEGFDFALALYVGVVLLMLWLKVAIDLILP